MAEVFVSYKSDRRNAAQHLARVLELYGYTVWFDYWLLSGKDFGRQIERELTEAKAVMVLWCPLSRESEWVLEEAHCAKEHGKLVPAWLERVALPLGFQRADTIDLSIWDGAPRGGRSFDRLIDELSRRVGRDPQTSFRALRGYEKTWSDFGSLRLMQFPLIHPSQEREEQRGIDQEAEEEAKRIEQEKREGADEEARRIEADKKRGFGFISTDADAAKAPRMPTTELKAEAMQQERKHSGGFIRFLFFLSIVLKGITYIILGFFPLYLLIITFMIFGRRL